MAHIVASNAVRNMLVLDSAALERPGPLIRPRPNIKTLLRSTDVISNNCEVFWESWQRRGSGHSFSASEPNRFPRVNNGSKLPPPRPLCPTPLDFVMTPWDHHFCVGYVFEMCSESPIQLFKIKI